MILPRHDDKPATQPSMKLADMTIDEFRQIYENKNLALMSILDCKTPTAKEYRIPDLLTCPPAPRKPRVRPAVLKPKNIGEIKVSLFIQFEEQWGSK